MGCNIHAYVEYKEFGNWRLFADVKLNTNYDLFACMAKVRNRVRKIAGFDPRGIPDDLSNSVTAKYTCYFHGKRVPYPDWHSASWLSWQELDQVHHKYIALGRDPYPPFGAVAAMMQELNKGVDETRLVFWFDN